MRSVELFAGAGGSALGTAFAGFRHEAVLEWNRDCVATIQENQRLNVKPVAEWPRVEKVDVTPYDFRPHHGVPGGENMVAYAKGDVRYFTVREAARLQAFPDRYVFQGAWTEAMRQLGSAVPVTLAKAVAESIKGHLRGFADAGPFSSTDSY